MDGKYLVAKNEDAIMQRLPQVNTWNRITVSLTKKGRISATFLSGKTTHYKPFAKDSFFLLMESSRACSRFLSASRFSSSFFFRASFFFWTFSFNAL